MLRQAQHKYAIALQWHSGQARLLRIYPTGTKHGGENYDIHVVLPFATEGTVPRRPWRAVSGHSRIRAQHSPAVFPKQKIQERIFCLGCQMLNTHLTQTPERPGRGK